MDPLLRALELLTGQCPIGPGPDRDMIWIDLDDTADPSSFVLIDVFDVMAF